MDISIGKVIDETAYRQLQALINQGDAEQVLSALEEYTQRQPQDQNGWNLQGQAHFRLRQYPAAIASYEKDAELAESSDSVRYALAQICSIHGDSCRALFWCDQAIALQRQPAYCLLRLQLLYRLEAPAFGDEAREEYAAAFPDDPALAAFDPTPYLSPA